MAKEEDNNKEEAVAIDTTVATPEKPKAAPRRKKIKRQVSHGQVHILASFNNTIVSITDENGHVLAASSAGSCGFRGSKKGTAYAAQVAAEKALEAAKTFGISKVDVIVQGIGLGRESAIRTLSGQKIAIESIRDKTGIPHGGARPRKPKRN
ncbi:TPA: 30S ribosomal protein S11 [Candidatus Saccharibacteria bacterium]|nr:MAG: 30S ribosomal protein S11 [Candidatus Saccharibacteria bacterium GW2011_GWA2_46_10]HCM51840.1 30S ribosomal protein S11 [Candidatus Saccharibacteria bacterium]